jgi:hypothetical protein
MSKQIDLSTAKILRRDDDPIAVRCDLFPNTVLLYCTQSEKTVGSLNVTWTDEPESLEKLLKVLSDFITQIRTAQASVHPAANG